MKILQVISLDAFKNLILSHEPRKIAHKGLLRFKRMKKIYNNFDFKCVSCSSIGIDASYIQYNKLIPGWRINTIDSNGNESYLTLDHIYPKSKGGFSKLNNLQPMCWKCNNKKGNQIQKETPCFHFKNSQPNATENRLSVMR